MSLLREREEANPSTDTAPIETAGLSVTGETTQTSGAITAAETAGYDGAMMAEALDINALMTSIRL